MSKKFVIKQPPKQSSFMMSEEVLFKKILLLALAITLIISISACSKPGVNRNEKRYASRWGDILKACDQNCMFIQWEKGNILGAECNQGVTDAANAVAIDLKNGSDVWEISFEPVGSEAYIRGAKCFLEKWKQKGRPKLFRSFD